MTPLLFDAVSPIALRLVFRRLLLGTVIMLLIFPWLGPYTAGPTPNAWPLLLSAVCALALWLCRRSLDAHLIAVSWISAAAISSLIGMAQYFGFSHFFPGLMSQTLAGEAFGNLRQRNQFATLTSIGLVALLYIFQSGLEKYKAHAAWWVALAVLLALGNAASSSRTGFLQWVLIVVLSLCWNHQERRRQVAFALTALVEYLIGTVALPWLLMGITGLSNAGLFGRLVTSAGCSSRSILWSNVLTLIGQKPWFGWGWGGLNYAHFMTLYDGPRFCEILDNAHNLPLHLAVELGVPAALAICGGLGWAVWRQKPWRETNSSRQMVWGVLAVIALHSLLEYPLWYGPFQIAVGLCIWLLWQQPLSVSLLSPSSNFHAQNDDLNATVTVTVTKKFSVLPCVTTLFYIATTIILLMLATSYYRVSQIYLAPENRGLAYRDDTLSKIRGTLFFRNQAKFAELSVTTLTPENVKVIHSMAMDVLHYSPEPRVVATLIESAMMLGRNQEAAFYLTRFHAAYPGDYARWMVNHPAAASIRQQPD